MTRLIRLVLAGLGALLVYSIVNEVWRAVTFDSEYTGVVQRAYSGDPLLETEVARLAADKSITLIDNSFRVIPAGGRTEVAVRYTVPLGLGSLHYVWERSVSAFTEGAAPFGAPLSGAQTPSAPRPGPGMMGAPSAVRRSLQNATGR
jgi:hypothetical protein